MGLWQNLKTLWSGDLRQGGPDRGVRKPVGQSPSFAERFTRAFNAAQKTLLTGDWSIFQSSTDKDLYRGLKILRNRSRDLSKNSPYARKYLEIAVNSIIGAKGIALQVRATRNTSDKPDRKLNDQVETAWSEWCRMGVCDVTGQLSFLDAERLLVRTKFRDGEALVRLIDNAPNDFGFAIQFIPVEWLDESFTCTGDNGNRIVMSVELDQYDRPVAYHLTPPETDIFPRLVRSRKRERVEAKDIIHLYRKDDPNQTRGIPPMSPAMTYLQMLDGYIEAELTAARAGAAQMAFYVEPPAVEYVGDEKAEPALVQQLTPGMIGLLPHGYDLKQVNPQHPVTAFKEFVSAALKGIASGFNVAHATLSSDLGDVNYSSIRAGLIEERDHWKSLQTFVIEHFCQPVYERWLRAALLSGQIDLTPQKFQKVLRPVWLPRGFSWVDPEKDVNSSILAIENGLTTATDVCAEQGKDFEENLYQIKAEQDLQETLGVKLGKKAPVPSKPELAKDQGATDQQAP